MYQLSVRVAHEHQLTSGGRPVDVVEVASPTQHVGPGVPAEITALLGSERDRLVATSAERGVDGVVGIGTRIGLIVPGDRSEAVGRQVARHCLGALADVVGSSADVSAGIAVRPRRGWVELRTEHVDGDDLAAALVLLAGCVTSLLLGAGAPATSRPRLSASRGRPGWLAEDPGGGDLGIVWAWARTGARAWGLDPTPVDDRADGSTPLRRERLATSVPVQG